MGGTFLQVAGEVKYHVMPDFSPCPLDSDEKVSQWLRFYTFGAPFVNMATFISKDPGNVSIYRNSCVFCCVRKFMVESSNNFKIHVR